MYLCKITPFYQTHHYYATYRIFFNKLRFNEMGVLDMISITLVWLYRRESELFSSKVCVDIVLYASKCWERKGTLSRKASKSLQPWFKVSVKIFGMQHILICVPKMNKGLMGFEKQTTFLRTTDRHLIQAIY